MSNNQKIQHWKTVNSYYTKDIIDQNLDNKLDKVSGKQLSTNDYTTTQKNKLSNIESNAQVNKIENVKVNDTNLTITNKSVNIDLSNYVTNNSLSSSLNNKLDKEEGKQLSTNDFTKSYKDKLDGIQNNAQVNKIENVKVNNTNLTITNKSVNIDLTGYISEHNTSLAAHENGFNHDIILSKTSNSNTYKTWLKNDGSNFYVLVSNANGSSWNSNYPLYISLSSGNAVTIGTALQVSSAATFNSNITVSGTVTANGTVTINNSLVIHGNTSTRSIEFYPVNTSNHGGFIDFHFNGSTSDYTSRIIEGASGQISINPTIKTSNIVASNATFNWDISVGAFIDVGTKITTQNTGGGIRFHYKGASTATCTLQQSESGKIICSNNFTVNNNLYITNGNIYIGVTGGTRPALIQFKADNYAHQLWSDDGTFYILGKKPDGTLTDWRPFYVSFSDKTVHIDSSNSNLAGLPNYSGISDITSAWSTGVWTATANGWILIGTAEKDAIYSLYAGTNADKLVFHIGNHDEYIMTSYPIPVIKGQKYTLKKGSSGYREPATNAIVAPSKFVYFIPVR